MDGIFCTCAAVLQIIYINFNKIPIYKRSSKSGLYILKENVILFPIES